MCACAYEWYPCFSFVMVARLKYLTDPPVVINTCCQSGIKIVVAVAFQNAFRAEIYQNDVFLFFKNHF